jgi:hypothetical protein
MTGDLAHRAVQERAQVGGFSSVEGLGLVLDLPMRDMATFNKG